MVAKILKARGKNAKQEIKAAKKAKKTAENTRAKAHTRNSLQEAYS